MEKTADKDRLGIIGKILLVLAWLIIGIVFLIALPTVQAHPERLTSLIAIMGLLWGAKKYEQIKRRLDRTERRLAVLEASIPLR